VTTSTSQQHIEVRGKANISRISQILLWCHDAGIIFQSLCLIPFTLALDAIARRHSPGSSRVMVAAAVTFLTLVVVLILLSFVKVVADVLYTIPQGAVGAWLIVVCRQIANGLPKGLLAETQHQIQPRPRQDLRAPETRGPSWGFVQEREGANPSTSSTAGLIPRESEGVPAYTAATWCGQSLLTWLG
jgi:hypothetical protein